MKTTKATIRQQEIINQAFRVWGESCFYKTSLSSLARSLGLSKTALYRYFSGKEALLQAMREHFLQVHENLSREFLEKASGKSFWKRFDLYNRIIVQFYSEHYWYCRFVFIFFLPRAEEGMNALQSLKEYQKVLFPREQLQSELGWGEGAVRRVQEYISTSAVFLLFHNSLKAFHFEEKSISEANIKDGADALFSKMIKEGLAGKDQPGLCDFAAVEEQCWVDRSELLKSDRIFSAIAEVVGEMGLWEASIEKIARKAGMSKSSLYFHFRNRNDMLWEMIERELYRIRQLFEEKSASFETFEQRLYGYFVVFSSYMNHRRDILAVMKWLIFQGSKITFPLINQEAVKKHIQFLRDGVVSQKLRDDIFQPVEMIKWIHHFLTLGIQEMVSAQQSEEEHRQMLRVSYKLFLFGARGE